MYIVTFYSFKGGVGRTLALANVALELVRTGRRVLIVDFDLEAPGIDTFSLISPKEQHQGIVEYVTEYMEKGMVPDVREYIYEVTEVGQKGGRLWVMPAGRGDEKYGEKLSFIDWQKLYDESNGFLMIEDLKMQWETSFQPDYVLIDSRTGYTDVGGICTRQLPNAVVMLFLPNTQNLNGLKPIVSCISDECKKEDRNIKLHFVMSNVPDLDDEDGILVDLQQRFRKELNYEELSCIIHRYDSLRLLNQVLFVSERPRSRLAKEYRTLADAITKDNYEDRQAVVKRLIAKPLFRLRSKSQENLNSFTDNILKYHNRDGQIVYLLAMEMKQRGLIEQSEILVKKSLELGYRSPEALLAEAETSLRDLDIMRAVKIVLEAFESYDVEEDVLTRGIEILRRIAPKRLLDLPETNAFKKLKLFKILAIIYEIIYCKEGLEAALKLLLPYHADTSITVGDSNSIRDTLFMILIGLSRFDQAIALFGNSISPEDLNIAESFNYAMAEWGKTGLPNKNMFEHVIQLDKKTGTDNGANYNQCLAIAFWVIENKTKSLEKLDIAVSSISERPRPEFSCWRYMQAVPEEFDKDCKDIRRLINGEKVRPLFMS